LVKSKNNKATLSKPKNTHKFDKIESVKDKMMRNKIFSPGPITGKQSPNKMNSPRLSLSKAHIFGMIADKEKSPKKTDIPEDLSSNNVVYNKVNTLPKTKYPSTKLLVN
jgi:hypothetical protein